jgi:hypothetical protein
MKQILVILLVVMSVLLVSCGEGIPEEPVIPDEEDEQPPITEKAFDFKEETPSPDETKQPVKIVKTFNVEEPLIFYDSPLLFGSGTVPQILDELFPEDKIYRCNFLEETIKSPVTRNYDALILESYPSILTAIFEYRNGDGWKEHTFSRTCVLKNLFFNSLQPAPLFLSFNDFTHSMHVSCCSKIIIIGRIELPKSRKSTHHFHLQLIFNSLLIPRLTS